MIPTTPLRKYRYPVVIDEEDLNTLYCKIEDLEAERDKLKKMLNESFREK